MPNDKDYKTKDWFRARYKCLERFPECEACKRVGRVTESKVADHMLHKDQCSRYNIGIYDVSNLIGLCKDCHHKVTKEFDNKKRWTEFDLSKENEWHRLFKVKYNVNVMLYDDDGFPIEP